MSHNQTPPHPPSPTVSSAPHPPTSTTVSPHIPTPTISSQPSGGEERPRRLSLVPPLQLQHPPAGATPGAAPGRPLGRVKCVGNYTLTGVLGRGTFGKVSSAINRLTGKVAAIKIFDKELVQRKRMADQLRKEICILKMVTHPNVVKLFEVLHSRTRIFLVMELVPDGELFDRIVSEGRLSEDFARSLFQQLVAGLRYCHKQGIYHRDLKPENLLLEGTGPDTILKISDFGLSFIHQQEEESPDICFTTCGTPNYVAPEVIRRQGYDGRTADVWSAGVILFVMLSGRLPFDEPHLSQLFRKIVNADFTWPAHFSDGAKALIAKILQPDPASRATLEQIMQDPWFIINNRHMATEPTLLPTPSSEDLRLAMQEVVPQPSMTPRDGEGIVTPREDAGFITPEPSPRPETLSPRV